MKLHQLQTHLAEIQCKIDAFRKAQITSKNSYKKSLGLLVDLNLRSLLMENYVINTERQRASIIKLEELYSYVQNLIANSEESFS